jgi:beta-ribofuranosylaminobenzene 5'-phosphate synthase
MLLTTHANPVNNQVTVTTSARLHMGFFDLTSNAARMFGGLGLAIDAPCTQIEIKHSEKLHVDAKSSNSVAKIVDNLIISLNVPNNFSLKVMQSIPEHAGLGSGTQMALAVGTGLSQLFNLNLTTTQIATASMRGKRSGIGLGAFSQGGFLIDSGKIANALPSQLPSIDIRFDFPDHWRVLLVLDSAHMGVHGAVEFEAFKTLKPAQFDLKDMLQQHMLPALQRADLLAFGAYMQDLQAYNGDYFAPIQGGRYASLDAANALAWLQTNGAACVGQSSWGPTGFAILENQQQAESLQTQAQLAFAARSNISFQIVRGKNAGASIQLG